MADEERRDGAYEHCTFGGGIPDGSPENGELPPEYTGGPGSFWERADISSKLYSPDEMISSIHGLRYRTPVNGQFTYYGEWGRYNGKFFVRSPIDGVKLFDYFHSLKFPDTADGEGQTFGTWGTRQTEAGTEYIVHPRGGNSTVIGDETAFRNWVRQNGLQYDGLGAWLDQRGVMDAATTSELPREALERELAEQADRETGGFPHEGFYAAASPAMKMLMRNLTRLTGNGWETLRMYASAAHVNDLYFQEARLNMFERFRSMSADEFDAAMERVPTPLFEQTLAGRLLQKQLWLQNGLYDRDAVLNYVSRALNLPDYGGLLEEYRNRIQATASGLTSPQYRTYQALVAAGRKFGWSMDDLNMYRLAKHVAERSVLAQTNTADLAERFGMDEADILSLFPNLKNPTAFPHFNRETGMLDRDNAAPRSASEVLDDARAYLDSIPEDKARHLNTANEQLTREYMHAIDSMLAEGFINAKEHAVFANSPNYLPLREVDLLTGIRPLTDAPIVGRATEAENPVSQMLGFLEGVHRRNAQNRVNSLVYRWAVDASKAGFVKINRSAPGRGVDEFSRTNDILVHFPNPDKNGDIIVMRVSFDTSHPLGKLLAQSYLPPQQRGRFYETLAGFTRFASIMMTNASPAWALKSTAWNLGITPFAVQSAFGLSTRDAARFNFSNTGKSPFLFNVARIYRDMWNPKADHLNDPVVRWLYENGAGTMNDQRYQPGRAAARADFEMQDLRRQFREKPFDALQQGARTAWREVLHISHTPDIAFQLGAAKTYIEMRAGRTFSDYNELAAYMRQNPTIAQQALNGSRRILPNFTRRGAMTTLSSFYPFFNASAQTLPYMKQLASSPTGLLGTGLGIVMGYATLELAHDELGEQGDHLKNADANVYLGHGVQVPMDYAYHPALMIGNQLWKLINGKTDMTSALGSVAHSMMESISPIGAPQEGQATTNWALYNIAPYFVRPAIVGLSGMDQYGNMVDADTVVDANSGRRIQDPHPYQLARPNTPSWAQYIAKGIYDVFGDISLATPGRIAGMTSQIMPIAPHMFDVFGGTSQLKNGEAPTALGGLADLLAPSFQAQTNDYGPREDFEQRRSEALRSISNPAGLPLTEQNLLTSLGPKANRVQVITNNAAHAERQVRVNGLTLPRIRAYLTQAQGPGGSHADVVKYRLMLEEGQRKVARIRERYLKELPND